MPTFDTPNTQTTWTVPDGVSTISFELQGAGGGAASYARQPGGFASGEYDIAGGSELTVYVGGGGADGSDGGVGGQSPLADGGNGDQDTFDPVGGGGGGGATAIEAPDGTLIAAADAAGGSGQSVQADTFYPGGGGARGGDRGTDDVRGNDASDGAGSGFGGDGGSVDAGTQSVNPGEPGGAAVAAAVSNATTTTGGGTTGDGVVTLTVPLSWNAATVGVASTADGTGLAVSWTDDPSVGEYTIEHRDADASTWTATTIAAPADTYTITGLTQGTAYEVRVTASTATESTTSPIRTATTLLPAPTDLQATGTTATSLSVAWTRHHAAGQTRVECKPTDESQWGAAAPGGAETTVDNATESATLTGLRNAERYDVRAVAVTADAAAVDYDPDVTTGETLTVAAGETVAVEKPYENSGVVEVGGVLQPSDSQ